MGQCRGRKHEGHSVRLPEGRAARSCADKLTAARNFASSDNPQAIAFSAPTGSGKTIVMTALFEAILDEPDDQLEWPLDWQPQRDAVILWVSDMPELNEQTKLKIESKSDRVYRVNQLDPHRLQLRCRASGGRQGVFRQYPEAGQR